VTLTGTTSATIRQSAEPAGWEPKAATLGGAISVGSAVLFGIPDTSSLTINGGSQLVSNEAIGGVGGPNGGDGKGGGLAVLAGSAIVSGSTINANQAIGGDGGTSGNGGDGLGGGLYNRGTLSLIQSTITGNKAKGGAAGQRWPVW
jgi:hypothetical protein